MDIIVYVSPNRTIQKLAKLTKTLAQSQFPITVKVIENKKVFFEALQENQTVIIFAHGGYDRIYENWTNGSPSNIKILIDENNDDVLRGKRVLAFSCYTATTLGPHSVSKGCDVYLGFSQPINLELQNKGNTTPQVRFFLDGVYDLTFAEVILDAINNNMTFERIERKLKHELNRCVVEQVVKCQVDEEKCCFCGQSFSARLIPEIILTVKQTVEAIQCLGNQQASFY